RRRRRPASRRSCSTVADICTTGASQRSPRVPARAASSSEGRARWLLIIEAGRVGAADAGRARDAADRGQDVAVRGVAGALAIVPVDRAAISAAAATVIAAAVVAAAKRILPRA